MKNKRGFTLAEAVIAAAVVFLLSAAALTAVALFMRTTEARKRDDDALRTAENVLECFKYADSASEFEALVGELGLTCAGGQIARADGAIEAAYSFLSGEARLTLRAYDGERVLFSLDDYRKAVASGG